MQFNDRRGAGLIDPTASTAEGYRRGLKAPDKMGQSSRAKYSRLASVDRSVSAGSAAYMGPVNQFSPVPPVVQQSMSRSQMMAHPNTVVPGAAAGRGLAVRNFMTKPRGLSKRKS